MSPPEAFQIMALNFARRRPPLWRTQHDRRPARSGPYAMFAGGMLMFADLVNAMLHVAAIA